MNEEKIDERLDSSQNKKRKNMINSIVQTQKTFKRRRKNKVQKSR